MVLEAHNQVFAFSGGLLARLIYDKLKIVVDANSIVKERKFNRHFLCLVNHYLLRASYPSPNSIPGWHIAARDWHNAIQHSPPGAGIMGLASLSSRKQSRIAVSNPCQPITKIHLPHLFDRFLIESTPPAMIATNAKIALIQL